MEKHQLSSIHENKSNLKKQYIDKIFINYFFITILKDKSLIMKYSLLTLHILYSISSYYQYIPQIQITINRKSNKLQYISNPKQKKKLNMNMHIQGYNPSQIKLYSKYARNMAKKCSLNFPQSTSHKKTISNLDQEELFTSLNNKEKKKKKCVCTFDMTQSRQQREKKYHKLTTPSIGQYNPKTTQKIKFNWDILKIYHNQNKNKKSITKIDPHKHTQKQHQKIIQIIHTHQPQQHTTLQTQPINHATISNILHQAPTIQKFENMLLEANHFVHEQLKNNNTSRCKTQIRRYRPLGCQVNMSRMTGREEQKPIITQNYTNLQINKSIIFIKNKTTQNIDFRKQISRQKAQSLSKPIIHSNDYTYNISIIKPKSSTALSFSKTVGREPHKKRLTDQIYVYGYSNFTKPLKLSPRKNTSLNLRKKTVTTMTKVNNLQQKYHTLERQ